jgi:Xaa-Pro dipeptidase
MADSRDMDGDFGGFPLFCYEPNSAHAATMLPTPKLHARHHAIACVIFIERVTLPMSTDGYPRFSDAEIARRHTAARAIMAEKGVEALLVFGHSGNRRHYQADVHYFAEVATFHESYLLLPLEGEPVFWTTHNNHYPNARELSRIEDMRKASRKDGSGKVIAEELRRRGFDTARIGMVGTFFYQEVDAIRSALPDMKLVDLSLPIKLLRTRKSTEELAYQRIAAQGCDAVMEAIRDAIRPGVEERDLQIVSENAAWASGCAPTFLYLNSTSMANSDSCVPNQLLSRRKLQMGDVINTELTVNYGLYCSQILRPFFLGEPTAQYRKINELMNSVYRQMREAVRAGVSADELVEITRQIEAAGYITVDGAGHGFGVDIQPPSLPQGFRPASPAGYVFEANTTVVLQPNPATPDMLAGMQIGDMGLVTETGFESMQSYPAEVTCL